MKPALQRSIARYFWIRNEDGSCLRELVFRTMDTFGYLGRNLASGALSWCSKTKVDIHVALESAFNSRGPEQLTVVVASRASPQSVERIVQAYSSYSVVGDIVVWSNDGEAGFGSGSYPHVRTVISKLDPGPDARWAAASLGDHEHVLIQDDDLLLSEKHIRFLFGRYLKQRHLLHGTFGHNLAQYKSFKVAFGRVDIVTSPCVLLNRRYIPKYFEHIVRFDDLRDQGLCEGEDIIMSYVVRSMTGEKNLAWPVKYSTLEVEKALSGGPIAQKARMDFVGGISPRSESVRVAIARRCVELFEDKSSPLKVDDDWINDPGRLSSVPRSRSQTEPDAAHKQENFALSENLSEERFARALSLLCRRPAVWNDSACIDSSGRSAEDLSPRRLIRIS